MRLKHPRALSKRLPGPPRELKERARASPLRLWIKCPATRKWAGGHNDRFGDGLDIPGWRTS